MAVTSYQSDKVGGGIIIILNHDSHLMGSTVEVYYSLGLLPTTVISVKCSSNTKQIIIRLPSQDLLSYGDSGKLTLQVNPSSGDPLYPLGNDIIRFDYSDYHQRTTWSSYLYDNW